MAERACANSAAAAAEIRCALHRCSDKTERDGFMANDSEVTVERDGRTYAATYAVEHGMVCVKTHTETRSVELGNSTPEAIARSVLNEIIDSQASK